MLIIALLGIMPYLAPRWMTTLTFASFFAIFAMSWDILASTGQISFGHAFFIGVAAYASGLLNTYLMLPPWATIPLGMLAAGLVGLLVGWPALRLRGAYLALVTLILPIAALKLVIIFSSITGGELGKPVTPFPNVDIRTPYQTFQRINYYYALGLMALVGASLIFIATSRLGVIFEAIREDEDAAEAAGLNTAKFKILAFVISATAAGLGGAGYVHVGSFPYVQPIGPDGVFSSELSILLIVASVAGGLGTIIGPLVGAYALKVGQQYLRDLAGQMPGLAFLDKWTTLIFLLLLLILVLFVRQGLVSLLVKVINKFGKGP